MALDEKELITAVEETIKRTSSEEGAYNHNLRFQFGDFKTMMEARTFLCRNYHYRFKILTEIHPPANIYPSEDRDLFNKKTKYYVLMERF